MSLLSYILNPISPRGASGGPAHGSSSPADSRYSGKLPASDNLSSYSTHSKNNRISSSSTGGSHKMRRSPSLNSLSSTMSQSPDPCKEDLPVMKLTDTFREMKHKMQVQEQQFNSLQERKETLLGKMKRMDQRVRDLMQRKEELEMELKRIERKQTHVKDELNHSALRFSEMTNKSRKLEKEIEAIWHSDNHVYHQYHQQQQGSSSAALYEQHQSECATFEGHATAVLSVAISGGGHSSSGAYFADSTFQPRGESSSASDDMFQSSGNTQLLASGARDGIIRLWNVATSSNGTSLPCGSCCAVLRGHKGWVKTLSFDSHSPRFLLSGAGDRQVRMWDTRTNSCVSIFKGHAAGVTCLQSDEANIVSGSLDKTIRCWDKVTGRCVARFRGHSKFVKSVRFESHAMISAGGDDHIRLWDMRNGKCVRVFHHVGGSNSLCYTDDHIISAGRNGTIHTFDLKSGEIVNSLKVGAPICSMDLKDSVLTYCTSSIPTIYQYDIHAHSTVREFNGHIRSPTDIALGDGIVCSSSWDSTVRVYPTMLLP